MPNWCSNEERIIGPKNEIVPLFQNIRKWTSKNYRENGFGNLWLGNIVLGAGFEVDGNSENCLRCRGALSREPELYDEIRMHLQRSSTKCPTMRLSARTISSISTVTSMMVESCDNMEVEENEIQGNHFAVGELEGQQP